MGFPFTLDEVATVVAGGGVNQCSSEPWGSRPSPVSTVIGCRIAHPNGCLPVVEGNHVMSNRTVRNYYLPVVLLITFSLLLVSSNLFAQSGFDPRSMGMGGTGVAVANPATAPFFNPAVLSIEERERFSIDGPILGVRAYDPNNFRNELNSFQNLDLVDGLQTSISNFNLAPSEASSTAVVASINELNDSLGALGGSPVQANLGIGLTLGDTGQKFGWAIYTTGNGAFGTLFNYRDGAFLGGFADAIDQVNFDNPASNTTAQLDALADFITYDVDPNTGEITNVQVVDFSEDNIESTVDVMGLGWMEVGVSLSTHLGDFACGVTPKFVRARIFDYSASALSADVSDFDVTDYQTDYENFNIDIGFARETADGWIIGMVGKNLIEQKYKGYRRDPVTQVIEPTGNVITISPTIQVGAARQEEWGTVAVDFDLQETEGFNGLPGSQYLSTGVELDPWGWGQVRAGYRANLSDSERSVLSAGIGISPFGIHVDLAVAGNKNELGAAAQFGFRF